MPRHSELAFALTALLTAASCGDDAGKSAVPAETLCVRCSTPPSPPSADCAAGECGIATCPDLPGSPFLGPTLGAVTDSAVRVWVRAPGAAGLTVRLWDDDDPRAAPRDLSGPAPAPEADFTAVIPVEALAPDHGYRYAVLVQGENGTTCSVGLGPTRFRTLPPAGSPGRYRFTVSADIDFAELSVFDRMAAHDPHFAVFLGDTIYADQLPPTLDAYRARYRDTVARPGLRRFLGHVPLYATWDDHETTNDAYPGLDAPRSAVARQSYEEYVARVGEPALRVPGGYPFEIRAANTAFYMFDTRSFRDPNGAPDGPDKTMLGAAQRDDFRSWLEDRTSALHVALTSVPFAAYATTGEDSWNGYAYERAALLAEIGSLTAGRALLVTGDQHWSGVFALPSSATGPTLFELMPTPVAQHNRLAPLLSSPDVLAIDDDHRVYAVIDVDTTRDPAELVYTLCDADAGCSPGEEPPPSGRDQPAASDDVPYTLFFAITDEGLLVRR